MKHFRKLDFVSEEIGFEVNNSRIYKTNSGAFLSLIISISSIIIAIMIGNEVYERKLPNVSVSSNYLEDSTISFTEYPIFFSVADTYGNYYDDYSQYLYFYLYKMNITNSIFEYSGILESSIHRCTMDDFSPYKGKIEDDLLKTFLDIPTTCMSFDENFLIKNPYDSPNSSSIVFSFSYCEGDNCAEDIEFALKEIYVKFYYMNAYVDSDDYENPIKNYIDVISQRLSYGFLKTKYVRFLNNEFISDNGWLFKNLKTYDYLALKDTYDEMNLSSPTYPTDMYWMTVESPNIREIGKRSYMKIQDLFAKVGGVINAIIIIINLLFYDYLRFIFKKDLVSYLISNKNAKFNVNSNYFSILNNSNINNYNKENSLDNNKTNNNINLGLKSNYYNDNDINNNIRENIKNNQINADSNIKISAFNNIKINNYNNINNNNETFIKNNINQFSMNNQHFSRIAFPGNNDDVVKNEDLIKQSELPKTNIVNHVINIRGENYDNNDCGSKINNTESKILKLSNISKEADMNYIDSLRTFKLRTKEELIAELKNITYVKYVMYIAFKSDSKQNEFLRHMLNIIREKLDFFRNIKRIKQD